MFLFLDLSGVSQVSMCKVLGFGESWRLLSTAFLKRDVWHQVWKFHLDILINVGSSSIIAIYLFLFWKEVFSAFYITFIPPNPKVVVHSSWTKGNRYLFTFERTLSDSILQGSGFQPLDCIQCWSANKRRLESMVYLNSVNNNCF